MRLIVVAAALIGGSSPAFAVEISNFKSGLACTNTRPAPDRQGWICQQTQDVLVTDQGSCVYNGETKLCTWIGFEFDYKGNEEHAKLQCVDETSAPTSPGNPHVVLATDVMSQPYELELDGDSGHFYNPMYYAFGVRSKENALVREKFTCKVDGAVLFEVKFDLHFPTMPN